MRGDAGGNQILFNPRAGDEPFRIVSLRQVMADQVPLDWVQDAVVLIGVTVPQRQGSGELCHVRLEKSWSGFMASNFRPMLPVRLLVLL